MKNLYSKIALTVIALAMVVCNVACTGGDSTFLTPDAGGATNAYNLAECIKNAGDDVAAAAACLK